MEVTVVQFAKALVAMLVTVLSIITVLQFVIVLNAPGIVLVNDDVPLIVTVDKLVHPVIPFNPILVTEVGIVMEVTFVQFAKALAAMLVTVYVVPNTVILVGIVAEVSAGDCPVVTIAVVPL